MLCLMQVNLCRSIKTLIDFEPPATTDEVNASALQFVRKTADWVPLQIGNFGSNQPCRCDGYRVIPSPLQTTRVHDQSVWTDPDPVRQIDASTHTQHLTIARGETGIPSLTSSSLAIRSSSQPGFSEAILRISARSSAGIRGLPILHLSRQNKRHPIRCQRMIV